MIKAVGGGIHADSPELIGGSARDAFQAISTRSPIRPRRIDVAVVAGIQPASPTKRQMIARYYRECWLDYRFFWINRKNLGMHFGYWDETTRTHAQSLLRTNEVMADAVDIGPGDRVLDAGCGVGGSQCDPSFFVAPPIGERSGQRPVGSAAQLRVLGPRGTSVTGDPGVILLASLQKLLRGGRNGNLRLAPVGKVRHSVTYRDITIVAFRINVKKLPRIKGARRVPLLDLSSALPVSNLTRKVARAVLAASTAR